MTTEEKARQYADQSTTYKTWGMHRQALIDAYLAGAAEALRSQWKDASKELPNKGDEVLVCFKDNPSEVYACDFDGDVFIGRHGVANNVYLWMSRPPLPDTEEQ